MGRRTALESLAMSPDSMQTEFWVGKRVFLTGHTGFKGGWLSLWLQQLGAEVHGYALPPPTEPNLCTVASVAQGMATSTIADIRDAGRLTGAMQAARPDIVFHLAAQPLVRLSYAEPVETYATNVMGTVGVLEAVRQTDTVKAVVNVTSDKCYENREWLWAYREDEAMGGHDPYSSSKACAEIVTAAYRRSFLEAAGVGLASARAGNVIGGGDWAADRLLPDFFRALDAGKALVIRSPNAVRPWQHVLEPLSGYLALAQRLFADRHACAEGWNFGPDDADARPVSWIVEQLTSARAGASWQLDRNPQLHEAGYLKLDSSKARARLGWQPRWDLRAALARTVEWHDAWRGGHDMRAMTLAQIAAYRSGE